jgi:hypothetical protein
VPSIAAAIIASGAGWIVDATVGSYIGLAGRIFLGIVVTTYVYVYTRNRLRDLRG